MMTNGRQRMSSLASRRAAPSVLVLFALLAILCTSAAAQQSEESIFRLVTFQTTGELRLGATEGNGQKDIVDIHNAILALKAAGAPEVNNLAYIPADMRSLIEVGDSAVNALKTVYRAALAHKTSGHLVDPGGGGRGRGGGGGPPHPGAPAGRRGPGRRRPGSPAGPDAPIDLLEVGECAGR